VYAVHLSRRAQKDLLKMPKGDARRVRTSLNDLAAEQDPQACVKKLKGHEDTPISSYRIGEYRIILTFDHGIMVIFVITIDNRRSVYRNV